MTIEFRRRRDDQLFASRRSISIKDFTVEVTADASRPILTVTITANNSGSATAYNMRLLDDLCDTRFTYIGNVAGDNPPTNVDTTTYGADSAALQLGSWLCRFRHRRARSASRSRSRVDADDVQPARRVLDNTIQADWTSLPSTRPRRSTRAGTIGVDGDVDGMRIGALPNAGDPLNDYEVGSERLGRTCRRLAITKTDLDTALVGTGDRRSQAVPCPQIDLPEGVSNAVALNDDLAFGNVSYVLSDNADFAISYEFVGITTINGQAPGAAAFTAVPADGASGPTVWDIGSVVTEAEDDSSVTNITPYIRIEYAARINNDVNTNVGNTLQNEATVNYTNGEDDSTEEVVDTTAAIAAIEPNLTTTKAISNVTAGKDPGDPIALNDIVQYVLTIPNIGTAMAYDVNVVDTLPVELELYSAFTPTAQINGIDVAGFVATPSGAPNGPLVWGAGNNDGSMDVAPGETLEITYQVQLTQPADENIAITNIVWTDWTSLQADSVYERSGDGCPITTAPNDYCFGPASADGTPFPVGAPDPLTKANSQATAAIGEPFTYRITIPSAPYPLPMHDVRILDDLSASAADLTFISVAKVSGSGDWTPVNSGTDKDLIVEDVAGGIDIPIGEQIVLDITVRLDDSATNVDGLTFTNLASYTYNRLNDAPATQLDGGAGLTQPMTVVEPHDLTVEKSGPPQMQLGIPSTFTLDVQNIGTSTAYGATLTDNLPNGDNGGTCDVAPGQFTAQVFEADGTTAASAALAEGTDFAVAFNADPDCSVNLSILSAAGAIAPTQRLLVTYQTTLDLDSQEDETLTNVAGATEWFSVDVSDDNLAPFARRYERALTDGTVGVLDHEDAHSALVFVPILIFEKTVSNLVTGDNPASVATPGDKLRYRLYVENASETPLSDFRIVDELDELNNVAAFQAGTLTLITVPEGADVSATDAAGGTKGTGLLDIGGLSLDSLGATVLIEFEVDLVPVIADDTLIYNQSEIRFAGLPVALSDDPNVNGVADPEVPGDEDPTQLEIESAPDFRVEKISSYVTGDPEVLLAGETLRYTITVQNVGTDNARDVELDDQVPANTTYVPGSTTLNGVAVADAAGGGSPLIDGILINAPQDSTAGVMNAVVPDNTATLVFDVVVDGDAADGTVLSNQAFVSALDQGLADLPSDDPRTEVADDPTMDVVGNFPLLFAPKTAALQVDGTTPGIVDPGDVLRYTITVFNNGAIPATTVDLSDQVPENTTYVADSLTLNGAPVGQPDGGVFPLANRIPISSSDLTPPLPNPLEGVLSPGESAVLQFDMRVNDDTPTGTLISNQATVYTAELPNLLTDGDGNPATGPEPTVVVVGDAQQLALTHSLAVVDGGPAVAGAMLEYTVTARNVASVPAYFVSMTDNLDEVTPDYLTYVTNSATLNGFPDGISVDGAM